MPAPRFFPFPPGRHRHRVGTRTVHSSRWIDLGWDADAQLAVKRRLLERHGDRIVQVFPGAPGPGGGAVDAACQELDEALRTHLLETFPNRYQLSRQPDGGAGGDVVDPRTGARYRAGLPASAPAIAAAGRLVPEDLCVHLPGTDGRLRLVAGCVAFPNGWSLPAKIGRTVGEVHAPVPGYRESIGAPVDQLLDRLSPERGLWRLNGSLLADSRLYRPGPEDSQPAREVRVPDGIVLRVERQTLRRLPRTGAVVFTIRTYVHPLRSIEDDPAACRDLTGWVRAMPPEVLRYKGLADWAPQVCRWLDRQAANGGSV